MTDTMYELSPFGLEVFDLELALADAEARYDSLANLADAALGDIRKLSCALHLMSRSEIFMVRDGRAARAGFGNIERALEPPRKREKSGLSTRIENCLFDAGLPVKRDLLSALPDVYILNIPGIGNKGLDEIRKWCAGQPQIQASEHKEENNSPPIRLVVNNSK